MKFHIGDKVKIAYISDCNPHNGKVGRITVLRPVNYYPNGDYSVVEQHVQAIIEYDDGTTEGVGDIYREGCGIVSPVEKVEGVRTIEFVAGYHEWQVIVDGEVIHAFDDFAESIEEDMTAEQVEGLAWNLVDTWRSECVDGELSFPLELEEQDDLVCLMVNKICRHYSIERDLFEEQKELLHKIAEMASDFDKQYGKKICMDWLVDSCNQTIKEIEIEQKESV